MSKEPKEDKEISPKEKQEEIPPKLMRPEEIPDVIPDGMFQGISEEKLEEKNQKKKKKR